MIKTVDFITTASMFQYFHMLILVIFSICIMMIQRTRAVYIWICSNVVAMLYIIYSMQVIERGLVSTNYLGELLLILSFSLKSMSLADRGFTRIYNRIPIMFLILTLTISPILMFLNDTEFRLILIFTISILVLLSAIFYLLNNKSWIGLLSLKYFVALLCLYLVVFIFWLVTAYPFGNKTRFIPADSTFPYQDIFLTVFIFFCHIRV